MDLWKVNNPKRAIRLHKEGKLNSALLTAINDVLPLEFNRIGLSLLSPYLRNIDAIGVLEEVCDYLDFLRERNLLLVALCYLPDSDRVILTYYLLDYFRDNNCYHLLLSVTREYIRYLSCKGICTLSLIACYAVQHKIMTWKEMTKYVDEFEHYSDSIPYIVRTILEKHPMNFHTDFHLVLLFP